MQPDDEILQDFAIEELEILENLDTQISALEAIPDNRSLSLRIPTVGDFALGN
ncbi:MAG: hypothetical protein HYX63_13750 [Gammaproteobacteria bacterium]|nr:hypothetical protein [Gammaproteobacteria bacterium]